MLCGNRTDTQDVQCMYQLIHAETPELVVGLAEVFVCPNTSYFDCCNGHSSGGCAGPDLVDSGGGCT